MNIKSLIILVSTFIPWISAPFIKKADWKRFLPVLIFIEAIMSIESFLAYKRKWWQFPKGTILYYLKDYPYMVGSFFIGTLWILKFTYGNFKKFMLVNVLIDSGFVYVLMGILKKLGIMRLVKLKKYQFLSFFMLKSLAIYGFQYLVDKKR
ncbi:hypothetical protein PU629_03665 [Pullulanibacillus sp. KACC 23026]|uniref:hypothetical protein n=1 Tax=Pullulanibacillus sp. KACC 23026 TaxID=3028315 RepID=UPI0023B0CFD3|nr:hypothetical protein [Pullulanibacillus sp. KACC 23026]WEG13479.1 hypothetical protein PU629_03665 [Pullulanibacillus sp. KACC 23026]